MLGERDWLAAEVVPPHGRRFQPEGLAQSAEGERRFLRRVEPLQVFLILAQDHPQRLASMALSLQDMVTDRKEVG
jgi:hypothetical protein